MMLCLDLLRAKSKGLVPMEIPFGLMPHLMTKGESAWRKVKIEGNRDKFPYGVFRRSNLGNEIKRGPRLQLEERLVGSPNPNPASRAKSISIFQNEQNVH